MGFCFLNPFSRRRTTCTDDDYEKHKWQYGGGYRKPLTRILANTQDYKVQKLQKIQKLEGIIMK